MKKIEFAQGMRLPAEFVTQPCAILARRGWGKTYAAKKLFEGLHKARAQVVVVDPVGNWNGLRTAADGKSPGLPVPVLGGLNGDIELREGDAVAVARVIVEQGSSAVLDVSMLSKAARQRFVGRLAEQLFQLKKMHRSPMHIILEEAQLFAPQRSNKGAERMLGAIEDLCRLGRNFGIGYTLVSQRPQSVNKEVLNQAEVLIVGQISGPQERKAIEGWIVEQGLDVSAMVADLPGLATGEAFLWSPSWLRTCRRIQIGTISTFDSSSTPALADSRPMAATQAAEIDADAWRQALETAGAAARDEDPRRMRRRILELEQQLADRPPELIEKPVLGEADRQTLGGLHGSIDRALGLIGDLSEQLQAFAGRLEAIERATEKEPSRPRPQPSTPPKRRAPVDLPANLNGLPKGQARVLAALVQSGGASSGRRAALVAGYSFKSSTMRNICSALRQAGLIEGSLTTELRVTEAGMDAASSVDPLPIGQELRDYWMGKVPGGAPHAVLGVLIDAWPATLSNDQIATSTGYSAKSSTLRNALSRLRILELVSSDRTHGTKASDDLFDTRR